MSNIIIKILQKSYYYCIKLWIHLAPYVWNVFSVSRPFQFMKNVRFSPSTFTQPWTHAPLKHLEYSIRHKYSIRLVSRELASFPETHGEKKFFFPNSFIYFFIFIVKLAEEVVSKVHPFSQIIERKWLKIHFK